MFGVDSDQGTQTVDISVRERPTDPRSKKKSAHQAGIVGGVFRDARDNGGAEVGNGKCENANS